MGRIVLVTGGARSGKSTYAESLFKESLDVAYIATSRVQDSEMQDRVMMHRKSRPSEWRTFEGTYELYKAVGEEKNYLLDCITVLTSNIMFDITADMERISVETQKEIEDKVIGEIESLVKRVREIDGNLVMVTNEIGSSIVPEHHISRVYRDVAGRVNQRLGRLSDEVYLVVCGIEMKIK